MQGLELAEILVEVEKRGSTFGDLLAIPERDDWVYADGQSASCVAFILQMYKAAGLFGPLASSIEVTEFTVSLMRMLCYLFGPVYAIPSILCCLCGQLTLKKLKFYGRGIF